MKEVVGDLWTYPADVRVITTNGFVKKNGEAVMGRGCALEATKKFPGIAALLGSRIKTRGNIVQILHDGPPALVSFPVKHQWMEKADPDLIGVGAMVLRAFADLQGWKTVVVPRPGCGNGGLKWEDVKPLLEPILDDRFHVITFKE
jgi:hypothetical protein